MHREAVRHPRLPQPSTQPMRVPALVLIQGGKLEDDPVLILLTALFLCELRKVIEKNRLRRLHALGKAASLIAPVMTPAEPAREEEVTGVHPILDNAALDRILADAPSPVDARGRTSVIRKPNKLKDWTISDEVVGQFVRAVLGWKGSLDDFMDRQTEKAMHSRMHRRQKFISSKDSRKLEWEALVEEVRMVVTAMHLTSRRSPEGHQIRWNQPGKHKPALEAAVCPKRKIVFRIYTGELPTRTPQQMVRPRPHGQRRSRS